MAYCSRVLSTKGDRVHALALQAALVEAGHTGVISVTAGEPSDWSQLVLRGADGLEIAVIERNPVEGNSLGARELEQFTHEIAQAEPQSAVNWLRRFFPRVRCIYRFQHLVGADQSQGFKMLAKIKNTLFWLASRAIMQSDEEGFTNEDGHHILWQFSDSVEGTCPMALLIDEEWILFLMDLGNQAHRDAFRRGQIPKGVRYVRLH